MKDGTDKVHRPPNIHESPDGCHASTTVNLLSNMDGPATGWERTVTLIGELGTVAPGNF